MVKINILEAWSDQKSTFPEKFKKPQNAIGSPVIAVSMTSQQLGTTGDRCYNSVQRRHRQIKFVANEYNEQVLTAHKVSFLGKLPLLVLYRRRPQVLMAQ